MTDRAVVGFGPDFHTQLLDALGQAVIATDADGAVIYWNAAAERLYGWTSAEAVGTLIQHLVVPETTEAEAAAIAGGLRKGEGWSGDFWVKRRHGDSFPVFVTDSPVFDDVGRLVAMVGVSADASARVSDQEAAARVAAIVEGSGAAIFGVSVAGEVTSWNAAAEEVFGYPPGEIVGRSVEMLAPPDLVAEERQMRIRLAAGARPERHDTIRLRKDGSRVDVLMSASSVRDHNGVVTGLSVVAHDVTERRSEQHALEESEQRLATAQRISHLGSFEVDVAAGTTIWSAEHSRILGLDPTAKADRSLLVSLVHPDDRKTLHDAWALGLADGSSFDVMFRIIRPDGSERCVRARAVPETDVDGTVVKMIGTLSDETDRVQSDNVRRAAEARFEIGFEQAANGAAIADLSGVAMRVNPAMCRLLGRTADMLVGKPWTSFGHPENNLLRETVVARVAAGHDHYENERRYFRPDGTIVWVLATVTLVRGSSCEPLYYFTQLQDITERKQMERDLIHQALHDPLTGLPNRALLADRLSHSLAGSRRRQSRLVVIFVGIDHLKEINETMGHASGDDLLRHASARLAAAIRPGDTVGRLGGDEFVFVCDNVPASETSEVAERILQSLREPWSLGGRTMSVSASLGVAIANADATPESLLSEAGLAMVRAKDRGRDRFELFNDVMRSTNDARIATTSSLRQALEGHEFVVYYQPVFDLATGATVGAEALVRWIHPDRGMVVPDVFIPIAEATGLMIPIGAWVLNEACLQLAQWQVSNPAMSVSVNVSVRQVMAVDIVGTVAHVLERTGIRPESLSLELTESVFMEDIEFFGRTLTALKALGVRLSIDDFGTGYSSLSYLKRFPFDAVKVDRAFVDGLGTDPQDSAIVSAIIAMAEALDLEVTAEGVETMQQLEIIKSLHCQRAQGFLMARPGPAEVMGPFVNKDFRWTSASRDAGRTPPRE